MEPPSIRADAAPAPSRVNLYCTQCESQLGIFENEWIRLTSSYARSKEQGTHVGCEIGNKTQTVPSGTNQIAAGCEMSEVFCKSCSSIVGQYCRSAPTSDKQYLVDQYFYRLSRIFLKDTETTLQVQPIFGFGGFQPITLTSRTSMLPPRRWSHTPLPEYVSLERARSMSWQSAQQNSDAFAPPTQIEELGSADRLSDHSSKTLSEQDARIANIEHRFDNLQNELRAFKASMDQIRRDLTVQKVAGEPFQNFIGTFESMLGAMKIVQSSQGELETLRAENQSLKEKLEKAAQAPNTTMPAPMMSHPVVPPIRTPKTPKPRGRPRKQVIQPKKRSSLHKQISASDIETIDQDPIVEAEVDFLQPRSSVVFDRPTEPAPVSSVDPAQPPSQDIGVTMIEIINTDEVQEMSTNQLDFSGSNDVISAAREETTTDNDDSLFADIQSVEERSDKPEAESGNLEVEKSETTNEVSTPTQLQTSRGSQSSSGHQIGEADTPMDMGASQEEFHETETLPIPDSIDFSDEESEEINIVSMESLCDGSVTGQTTDRQRPQTASSDQSDRQSDTKDQTEDQREGSETTDNAQKRRMGLRTRRATDTFVQEKSMQKPAKRKWSRWTEGPKIVDLEEVFVSTPETYAEQLEKKKARKALMGSKAVERRKAPSAAAQALDKELATLGLGHWIGKNKNNNEYRDEVREARARARLASGILQPSGQGLNVPRNGETNTQRDHSESTAEQWTSNAEHNEDLERLADTTPPGAENAVAEKPAMPKPVHALPETDIAVQTRRQQRLEKIRQRDRLAQEAMEREDSVMME